MISKREIEVLHWMSMGKTNADIALILGLAELTVKNHVSHLIKKMKCSNRAHVVAEGLRGGLIS